MTALDTADRAAALATAATAYNELRRLLGLAPVPLHVLLDKTTLAEWQARDREDATQTPAD